MFFIELMAIYCEGHVKHTNKLEGQNSVFLALKLLVCILITALRRIKT
jgi:hypothetical protein